jgi:hypothetical protein
VLADYASLAAEVSAAIVIGFLITVLVLMLNPSSEAVATGPVLSHQSEGMARE